MSFFKKRKKLWISIALVILVAVSAAFYFSNNRKKLIEVQVDKVKRQELISKVTSSGKIEPKRKVDISASIPGKIVRLAVEEGNRVQAGDFLLPIDPAPYRASVDNARVSLYAAQWKKARLQ
jgi:HlyD family secretion protein